MGRQYLRIFAVSLAVYLLTVTPTRADFEKALGALSVSDYATALKEFQESARKGDADASHYLSIMYLRGWGVPQNRTQAHLWFRKAAEQGHGKAQYLLASLYDSSSRQFLGGLLDRAVKDNPALNDIPEDGTQAFAWYLKAAESGHVRAQVGVATIFEAGKLVPKDYNKAAKWYRRAAEQGSVHGQSGLGNMYYEGKGVPQDYILAHMWLNLAAANSSQRAAGLRGFGWNPDVDKLSGYDQHIRALVEKKLTPSQIAEAQKLAREWEPKDENPCLALWMKYKPESNSLPLCRVTQHQSNYRRK